MRKDQGYREAKMRLVQKLTGIDFLRMRLYPANKARDWFSAVDRYDKFDTVHSRFYAGKPISVFRWPHDNDTTFHALFYIGNYGEICYITMTAEPGQNVTQIMGLHFCQFSMMRKVGSSEFKGYHVNRIAKADIDKANVFGLMLPYKRQQFVFQQQYTVVYCDWDVLRCNDGGGTSKGFPSLHGDLYSYEYLNQYLDLLK